MTSLRDQARRRLELNPITTQIAQQQQQQQQQQQHHLGSTPATAISASSFGAPFGYNPAIYNSTPVSAVRQYNPQQWFSSPAGASEQSSHYSSRPDPDVTIPAPPPYSPPRSQQQRVATMAAEDPASAISPATRAPPMNAYRPSPEISATPIFPPPPGGARARAGSAERQPFFNLSPFSRRSNAPEAPPPALEASREHVSHFRRSMVIRTDAPTPPPSDDDPSMFVDPAPPAARRCASAGAIGTPTSSRSRGSSVSRWEPGMPLPPPPPGPPPHSRSQSMNRTTDYVTAPPTRRSQPMSNLGPVPPTPAGWVEESLPSRGRSPNLTIDTSSITSSINSSSNNAGESNSGSSSSGLNRAGAVRGEPKSIRERRSESRTGKAIATTEEPSNNPWAEAITPADITLPLNTLTRRPTITKSTPRSGRSHLTDTPRSIDGNQRTPHSANLSTPGTAPNPESRGSTPRPPSSSRRPEAPTPPFSPSQSQMMQKEGSPAIPPKSLPTPPPQSRLSFTSPPRPISHILHAPIVDPIGTVPLTPSRPGSRQSSSRGPLPQEIAPDQFARSANERHQAFAIKEAAATTDEERVRIFADFIVSESRLRRDRYAAAIDAMGSEILELTRDLFRPSANSRRESGASRTSGWTPESTIDQRSNRGSMSNMSNSKDISLPSSEPTSGSASASPAKMRPDSSWWTEYRPSLSPIPSMSVSEAPDGSDSRGRPSSRWWEVSQEGSNGTPSARLERTKRESKYMGMPRELREAMQFETENPNHINGQASPGPSNGQVYGPNEYPPEKIGWHENPTSQPALHTAGKSPSPFSPAPVTPNPNHLDVSRLITLPPPYPRHHPAVNNNHPDLTSIRTAVRSISDFTEVQATKGRFLKTSSENREQLADATAKKRSSMRLNIQREIAAGQMTYAEAAVVEATALASEQDSTKEASKADFELFQTAVVLPLNDLLMDRINRATELFTQLRSKLFVDAQQQSPNLTQEEGDEQPELLEKLTLLKWIFEAREQLHREVYDLLSDRNDRYKEMVITPYRLSGNEGKSKNAIAFFADDAAKRKVEFEQEVLKRTEEFMDIIEENVVRGVEVQLSAFWDIAPSLSRLVEKIPRDGRELESFRIQIPQAEYEENPGYYDWPLQYLHSLLSHCEKSTYQFIESQINLLCLLHEVKGGVTAANCRLMRAQRLLQREREEEIDRELKEVEGDEEKRLTDDLKEKVRDVDKLWSEGLGSEIKGIRERIKGFLIERGGWCEDEE
ncbi:hypothetical protein B7463_g5042, partial [Scytalidium lignicola]